MMMCRWHLGSRVVRARITCACTCPCYVCTGEDSGAHACTCDALVTRARSGIRNKKKTLIEQTSYAALEPFF
jgi:hypothetical protein